MGKTLKRYVRSVNGLDCCGEDGGETGWEGRVSVLDESEYFVRNHVGSILKSHLSCVLTQGFQLLVVGNRFKCELQ